MSWLESIIYGIISGLSTFLPVSSQGQGALYLQLIGAGKEPSYQLAVHIGCLLAVFVSCGAELSKFSRERRIAALPKNRRKRQPDGKTMLDIRLIKAIVFPLVLVGCLLLWFSMGWSNAPWLNACYLALNGLILFIPQYFPTANKDSRSLSPLDSLLIGIAGGIGCFGGLSGLGTMVSAASLRGADKRYFLGIALILMIPILLLGAVFDVVSIVAFGSPGFSLWNFFLSGIFSAVGGYCSIGIIRFYTVKSGYSGFAYYCWGAAMLSLILYLIT